MKSPKVDAPTRPYRMGARAEAAQATRARILGAALELFYSAPYDDVSLEQIAARAGVALKTIQRRFGSKDGVMLAAAETERGMRDVPVGDLEGVVRVLSGRYEETMDMVMSYLAVAPRVEGIAELLIAARKGHFKWLAEAFAPHLPDPKDPLHRRRVAQLFAATEIYVWHSWRRHLGLGRDAATETLRELLQTLVSSWETQPSPSVKKEKKS